MDVFTEAAVKFLKELHGDLCQNVRRDRLLHRADLDQRFLRAGLLVFQEIFRTPVSVEMTGLPVPFMLSFAVIEIVVQIESTLDLFKGINDVVLLFLISGEVESLIAVPVNVLLCTFLIDMFTVGGIEPAVIVFWVVSSVLPDLPLGLVIFSGIYLSSFLKIMVCPCLLNPRKQESLSAGNTQY